MNNYQFGLHTLRTGEVMLDSEANINRRLHLVLNGLTVLGPFCVCESLTKKDRYHIGTYINNSGQILIELNANRSYDYIDAVDKINNAYRSYQSDQLTGGKK